jgi:cytochrome c553
MRRWWAIGAAGVAASVILCGASAPNLAAPSGDPPPDWAFVIFRKAKATVPQPKLVTVPGSRLHVTPKSVDDRFNIPDWFPADHAKPPEVVLHGHAPNLWACGYCHLPTGVGGPEDAVITGLPAAYIAEQFDEFRSGRRQCAVPAVRPCSQAMARVARAIDAAELQHAAAYFAGLSYRSRIHVIEAAIVPKTETEGFTLVRAKGSEPIGHRILEVPDNLVRFQDGDWRTTLTAYVPPGSTARGKLLVQTGAGALPCASCHGARLQGMGTAPPLAGRSPSYLVRQLYDIQYGFRRGSAVAPMLPEVTHLSADDRIAIAAYLAAQGG